ncbi:MAG: DNA repair protein RadA [Candidatus Caenarcaniphilales bacterium]|nr:DNA repair protein RadA [Candidatus Caenarcaniphilales bacterium]
MAKKSKSPGWYCRECGFESITYLGRCPGCNIWSSFIEQPAYDEKTTKSRHQRAFDRDSVLGISTPQRLENISLAIDHPRIRSGFQELDRILGGGLEKGSFGLLAGDPGIGKSTLLLQVADSIVRQGLKVLYISGEESATQIKGRAERLAIEGDLLLLAETNLDSVIRAIEETNPQIVVIDSIQSLSSDLRDSFPGSPNQIRHCAQELMPFAKQAGIVILLVGHINKEGQIAGPRLLEHMVDLVLYFEGDRQNTLRHLRSIKNRFGPTDEVGLFEMGETGLREVSNPSALFLNHLPAAKETSGVAITAIRQGSRVILAELQALTGFTAYPQPKRMFNGLDFNRANQVIAVLERRLGLNLSKQDIYASVVGGLQVDEPASDLALALAITSCVRDLSLPADMIAFGEIGLTGELRPVAWAEQRLKEAQRLGFKRALLPFANGLNPPSGIQCHMIQKLAEAFTICFQRKDTAIKPSCSARAGEVLVSE